MIYNKTAIIVRQQITQLKVRGLAITDDALADLFNKYPNVDLNAVGFPVDWRNEPLWQ